MTITLYTHKAGPNGWKVAILLEELGLKYESIYLNFQEGEQKKPEFTKHNPNGRIPCIVDHDNNDFTLWESAAIMKYIVERYDKEKKFHFAQGSNEYYEVEQWIAFQISGQGPYFGQAAWFGNFHPEKVPSAVTRYQKEVERVVSVLDGVLANKKYLVGEKATIADFSFIPWDNAIPWILTGAPEEIDIKKYKNFERWHKELNDRAAVKKVNDIKSKLG